MARVAINGLGRIGRATFKVLLENPELEVIAVNDLVPTDNLAYLLKHDTVYGNYDKSITHDDGENLTVEGKKYKVINERDPAKLPWKELNIDLVFECTGVFTKKDDLKKHIDAGARRVILSAPPKGEGIPTIVHGVNESEESDSIVSCASCTTNCITPIIEVISRRIGIEKAMMTTVHAYTSTQGLVDEPNKKMRRGRAAAANFVPTSTGAAVATTKVLPEFENRFDGAAIRGPVPVGSLADITMVLKRKTTVDEVNDIFHQEASTNRYNGVLGVTEEELVSSDIIKTTHASIVDLNSTQLVDGDLLKVMSWYDNEWGYVNQMVREAKRMVGTEATVEIG